MNFVDSFPPHDEKDIIYGITVGMLNPYCIVKVLPQGNKISDNGWGIAAIPLATPFESWAAIPILFAFLFI